MSALLHLNTQDKGPFCKAKRVCQRMHMSDTEQLVLHERYANLKLHRCTGGMKNKKGGGGRGEEGRDLSCTFECIHAERY